MKILKRGKKEKIKIFQFECRKCGCIFGDEEKVKREYGYMTFSDLQL